MLDNIYPLFTFDSITIVTLVDSPCTFGIVFNIRNKINDSALEYVQIYIVILPWLYKSNNSTFSNYILFISKLMRFQIFYCRYANNVSSVKNSTNIGQSARYAFAAKQEASFLGE